MKKTFILAAAALCTLLALASCDKNKNDGPKDETVVIPEVRAQGLYYGDFNGNGTGNVLLTLVKGDFSVGYDYDEDGYPIAFCTGTGFNLNLDFNMPFDEDSDHAKLVPGVYTAGDDVTFAEGTWNRGEWMSLYQEGKDGEFTVDGYLADGTLTIEEVKGGYKITFDGSLEDGTKVKVSTVWEGHLIADTEDTLYSNLDKDLKLTTLVKGNFVNFGDPSYEGLVDRLAIVLADRHYDLEADRGMGDYVYIYLNVEPGSEGIPTDVYSSWILDDDPSNPASSKPGDINVGCMIWGALYGGCWYFNPIKGYEVALVDGYLDIEALGGDKYKVSGELIDPYGKKLTISYNGLLPEVIRENNDEEGELSVKSQNRVPNFYTRFSATRMSRK